MPVCSVCNHPERKIIDSLLASRLESQTVIASRYGIRQQAISRHNSVGHSREAIEAAIDRAAKQSADLVIDTFKSAIQQGQHCGDLGAAAFEKLKPGDRARAAPAYMHVALKAAELLARAEQRPGFVPAATTLSVANAQIMVVLPRPNELISQPVAELEQLEIIDAEPSE